MKAREEEPGDDAGDEKARDRDVGRHAVHDHDDGGRDEESQRAGARERPDGHLLGVAPLHELGQRHLADGGAGRGARPRNRREDGAADDVGVQQAPRQALEPRGEALEHVLREPRAKKDLAHPHEERQRGERPRRKRTPDGDRHRVAHRAAREELHADPRDPEQRQADPQPAAQQDEEEGDEQRGDERVHYSIAFT
jgi:hypothetical protein